MTYDDAQNQGKAQSDPYEDTRLNGAFNDANASELRNGSENALLKDVGARNQIQFTINTDNHGFYGLN
jgi:hypothetical protein